MYFMKGEIISATYQDKVNEDAVFAILGIRDGSFEFRQESVTRPPNPITARTQSLLFEGCRLVDESTAGALPVETE